jgi:hypothetical protein
MRAGERPSTSDRKGEEHMRHIFGLVLALAGALALSAAISVAGASTKFAYTEQLTDSRSLVIDFEEGSLKRFASVDYQLDATETSRWDSCGGGSVEVNAVSVPLTSTSVDKGRTTGNVTVQLPPSDQLCAPQHVEYTNMTLTNVTTGHVYRLDPISRDYTT